VLPSKFERYGDAPADLAHKRSVRRQLQDFAAGPGATSWVVEFALDATGATTTSVPSAAVTSSCQVSLAPMTAEAAALITKVWISGLVPNTDMVVGSFIWTPPAVLAGVVATYRASVKG